jgi:hypothetical protein
MGMEIFLDFQNRWAFNRLGDTAADNSNIGQTVKDFFVP